MYILNFSVLVLRLLVLFLPTKRTTWQKLVVSPVPDGTFNPDLGYEKFKEL